MAMLAGALGGSAISGLFGMQAGKSQANAAKYAANLQYGLGQQQLAQNQAQFQTTQQNAAPWLQAGKQGLGSLSQLLSTPGQGLLTPWSQQFQPPPQFQAPTAAQAAQTPGYQFALQQGQNALQNSAAARGGLLSTGAAKTLDQYSQGLASQTYGDTYNRAMAEYQQNYAHALGEYQQNYNIFQGNQTNQFNRLAALSGIGQTAASTLGGQSNQASAIGAGIAGTIGGQVGGSIQNAGAARASGYAALGNAFGGAGSNISQYALLQQLLNQQQGGAFQPQGYNSPEAPPPEAPTYFG
jgi:hypothetical protein